MTREAAFEVTLLVHVRSEDLRQRIDAARELLTREVPLFESADSASFNVEESIQFRWERADVASDFLGRLARIAASGGTPSVIGVSDGFAVRTEVDAWEPSELTKNVRQLFIQDTSIQNGHFCGLVALLDGQPQRTKDIDRVVGMGEDTLPSLKAAINKAADGLWLKSPRNKPAPLSDDDAIKVYLVRRPSELEECLRLRHRVYDAMGYLPTEVASVPLEADHFDPTSLHFVAVDERLGEAVGAMRLALQDLPPFVSNSILGDPKETLGRQRRWLKQIVKTQPALKKLVNRPQMLPLPILENSDFGERWPEFLDHNRTKFGGEISRVVVAPRYQGLSVSRLLLRTGIAVAFDLRKQFLLLECIPSHVEMYRKYGFEPLAGHHCRAQGLDQIAVGMRLELDDSPLNAAVSLAKRQIAVLQRRPGDLASTSALCLCGHVRCWKDGGYGTLGSLECPLRGFHTTRLTSPV